MELYSSYKYNVPLKKIKQGRSTFLLAAPLSLSECTMRSGCTFYSVLFLPLGFKEREIIVNLVLEVQLVMSILADELTVANFLYFSSKRPFSFVKRVQGEQDSESVSRKAVVFSPKKMWVKPSHGDSE